MKPNENLPSEKLPILTKYPFEFNLLIDLSDDFLDLLGRCVNKQRFLDSIFIFFQK